MPLRTPPYNDGDVWSKSDMVESENAVYAAAVADAPGTGSSGATEVGRQLYVTTAGNDGNDGLKPTTAKRQLNAADAIAQPGDTINVASGSYNAANCTASGTVSRRIRWRSVVRHGAILNVLSSFHGDYVDVDGFACTGTASTVLNTGIHLLGNYSRVIRCYVHTLVIPDSANGGAGILLAGDSYETEGCEVHQCRVINIGDGTPNARVHGIYWSQPGAVIKNNVVATCSADGIQGWHGATQGVIVNNTVYNCRNGILVGSGDSGASLPGNVGTYCANNVLVHNSATGIQESGDGTHAAFGTIAANNLLYDSSYATVGPTDATENNPGAFGVDYVSGNLIANPLFVNTGTLDLRLQSGSPALDSGIGGPEIPNVDYEGVFRWGYPDRGAYERV